MSLCHELMIDKLIFILLQYLITQRAIGPDCRNHFRRRKMYARYRVNAGIIPSRINAAQLKIMNVNPNNRVI